MTNPNSNPNRPKVGNDEPLFKCPVCRTLLPGTHVTTFPFCSDRCRLIDLGNWLDGKYSVSRPLDPTDQLDDLLPDNPPPPPRTP